MKMFIALLVILINNVNAQENNVCSPFSFAPGVNSVVFGHLTAKGSSSGRLAVGGNAVLDQFSIGTRLSSRVDWGLVVGGDFDYECGDAHANVYYIGGIRVGPRVDWNTYQLFSSAPNVQISFSQSKIYADRLQESLTVLRNGGSSSGSIGSTFTFVGTGAAVELFTVGNCRDLGSSSTIEFSNINRDESTTVIIRVGGTTCSIGWDRVRGLPWSEPSTHVMWSYEATTLNVEGSVVGSVLAPAADVQCRNAYIEGQAYLGSVAGTIQFGPYLFTGCIPTDPCFVRVQSCPANEVVPGCISPTLVQDPENECCEIYECADSCDSVVCTEPDLSCPRNFVYNVVARAGERGADACCDTYACSFRNITDVEHPRSISCSDDLAADIPQGLNDVRVYWREPEFLFTQSVSSNFDSGSAFRAGQHVIEYIARGIRAGTSSYCMFTVTVSQELAGDTCTVGGRVYRNGDLVTDECMQRCVCVSGDLKNCIRIRQELQTMSAEDRHLYYQNYKTTYNHNDGVLRQYVDNHQQFFSRGLHNNGAFLPWHRGYLLQVENRLRQQDCRVTIPYWNWRLQPRISQANHFGTEVHQASGNGQRSTRCVNEGTFGFNNGFARTNGRCLQRRISGGATATYASAVALIRRYPAASGFDGFRNRLEHGPGLHDSVHCLVGGTMCSSSASNDPVFFNHHANIDKIWDEWQRQSDEHRFWYTGRTGRDSLMPSSTWTPAEMLDLMNLPIRVSVKYLEYGDEEQDMAYLNRMLNEMTEDEMGSIQSVGVGTVGDQWFIDMNMDEADVFTIRQGEELANTDVVKESVALTLSNAVERALQIPNLQEVIKAVSIRLAAAGGRANEVSASQMFRALSRSFVGHNLVPRFKELQDVIVQNEDGNTVEIITVPVSIVCPSVLQVVCTHAGLTFSSQCEAQQAGYSVASQGKCEPDPLPVAVEADVDGGASDAYNHGAQELEECPPRAPIEFSPCGAERLTCFYGQECCSISKITATCVGSSWRLSVLPWNNCNEAHGCGIPPEEVPRNSGTRTIHTLPRTTFPPTDSPTRSPPRPTNHPTQAPTRAPTTAPPTLPRTPPVQDRVVNLPSTSTISSVSGNTINWRNSVSRSPSPPARPTSTVTVSPSPPPPARTIVTNRNPPVTQVRRTTVTQTSRTVRPTNSRPPPVPRPRPSVSPVLTTTSVVLPPRPPLIVIPTICPAPEDCSDGPFCCRSGASLGTLNVFDNFGQVCGQSCLQCLRGGRFEIAPFCCRTQNSCPPPTCRSGREPVVRRPVGANFNVPCCPEYDCIVSDPCDSIVCPTLESTVCNFNHLIPAYSTTSPLMDPLGCCRTINCVFNRCGLETRACPDGSVLTRNPADRCNFPDCPAVCPNAQQQMFCPSEGGIQVPQDRRPAPDCSWVDCPDYEPCDDPTLRGCDVWGTCVRGMSVLTCECQPSYSGERCEQFTEPPRRKYAPFDRSVGLTTGCHAFMCNQGSCSYTSNVGVSWIPLPAELQSYAGSSSNYFWFVDQDDHMVTYDPSTRNVVGDRALDDIYDNLVRDGGVTPARSTYSYEVAVDGVLPPVQEAQWILNWGTDLTVAGPCSFLLYLTDLNLVFYTSENLHKTQWGTRTTNEVEIVQLCEDKCLLPNGRRQTCNDNGICVRETGVCVCDFGHRGDSCQLSS